MSLISKSLVSGRAWIAVFAFCLAAAPSAKAEILSLTIHAPGGVDPDFTSSSVTLTNGNGISNSGAFSNISFAGYSIDYRISGTYSPSSPSTQTVTLEARVVGSAAVTGTQSSLSFSLSGTGLMQPMGGQAFLSSLLSGVTNNAGSGYTLTTNGKVTNTTTTTPGNSASKTVVNSTLGGVFGDGPSAKVSIVGGLTPGYSLVNTTTEINFNNAADVSFVASSSVSLPEPASIMAGLMGLPCMGAALGFVRRRLTGATTAAELVA